MLNVKLKIGVMRYILCFVLEVGHKFLSGFPIGGFNIVAKITKHVWRDGEVLRRQGIITVEVVEALWIGEVAFYNVPRVAVGWNVVQIKV